MKYYVIAGEASGDLHASNLMKALKSKDKDAHFRVWGGDLMEQQGGVVVKHYRDLAFMGFVEVGLNIRTILHNISFCKKDILNWNPDVLILVDYPGFNLRIAEFAHKKGFKVVYYISPQIWAWKQNRVKKIKKIVDKMIVILPFEKEFYKKFNVDVDYEGHPLLDAIESEPRLDINKFREINGLTQKPIIALLPGSRKQEVNKILEVMLKLIPYFKEYEFIVCGVESLGTKFYKEIFEKQNVKVKLVFDQTHDTVFHSKAAIVTSGTATLETALIGTPEIVCYKSGKIFYAIAKKLVKLDYISLVNLIMGRLVVKEFIQDEMTVENIREELKRLLNDQKYRKKIIYDYNILRQKLGESGASTRVAEKIVTFLKQSKDK
jgi:lipid-A-disaccharide synthase